MKGWIKRLLIVIGVAGAWSVGAFWIKSFVVEDKPDWEAILFGYTAVLAAAGILFLIVYGINRLIAYIIHGE